MAERFPAPSRSSGQRESSPADSDSTAVKKAWQPNDIEDLRQRIIWLEDQLRELRAQVAEQRTSGDTPKMKEELDKSRKFISGLKDQLRQSEIELKDTRSQVQVLTKRSADLEKQSTADRKKIQALEEKERDLMKHMAQMEKQLDKKEKALKEMKNEIENMKHQIKIGQKELKNTKEELKQTKEELKSTKDDLKSTKEEIGKHFRDIDEKMKALEARSVEGDARQHVPCTDATSDVDTRASVNPRQGAGSFNLPPIYLNFPPKK